MLLQANSWKFWVGPRTRCFVHKNHFNSVHFVCISIIMYIIDKYLFVAISPLNDVHKTSCNSQRHVTEVYHTFGYKVMSERSSTLRVVRYILSTILSFALNIQSLSRPATCNTHMFNALISHTTISF